MTDKFIAELDFNIPSFGSLKDLTNNSLKFINTIHNFAAHSFSNIDANNLFDQNDELEDDSLIERLSPF